MVISHLLNGTDWDEKVGDIAVEMVKEIIAQVKENDPVKFDWHVPKTKNGIVWCDASRIVIRTVREVNGKII